MPETTAGDGTCYLIFEIELELTVENTVAWP